MQLFVKMPPLLPVLISQYSRRKRNFSDDDEKSQTQIEFYLQDKQTAIHDFSDASQGTKAEILFQSTDEFILSELPNQINSSWLLSAVANLVSLLFHLKFHQMSRSQDLQSGVASHFLSKSARNFHQLLPGESCPFSPIKRWQPTGAEKLLLGTYFGRRFLLTFFFEGKCGGQSLQAIEVHFYAL